MLIWRRVPCALLLALVGLVVADLPQSTNAKDAVATPVRVRVISSDFVLPGKIDKLARLAQTQGVQLDHVYVEKAGEDPTEWLSGVDLVILDTPRPMDLSKVQERVGAALAQSQAPWIRVGGGRPAFGHLSPPQARQLSAYYAAGGEANFRALFAYVAAWRSGASTGAIPPPVPVPKTGFYHPLATAPFSSIDDYLQWGRDRWREGAPRVAINIHAGLISSMETRVIDALVARSESLGLVPIVFWFDESDPEGLQRILGPVKADVLVIATHMQNGRARSTEFRKLNIPVIQTIGYRDGDAASWSKAQSGISARLAAPFLALPESWGASDPMVIDALENGEPAPIMPQIDALLQEAGRLAALRHKTAADKHLALMFWNYPPGEKNISASNLNVPRSLAQLTTALAAAGYDVPPTTEARLIPSMQALLGALYHPDRLQALLAEGMAVTLPVARYQAWLDELPAARRDELAARWGNPVDQADVLLIKGEKCFVIPRLTLGNLVILPQLPRSGRPGVDYHDTKQPPDHAYLAAYLYLRDVYGADALIHFGTHGTQEWTPGKDRGLATSDYPYLAVGSMPVFYPYIQDNVAEAIQAKRRGRTVTISHQTPPFAPAGLYDELRDLHAKIHEYIQLDEGAVRDRTAALIRKSVIASNLHRDMGWTEQRMESDFDAFLAALHDHVHELAKQAMPLGLHTFGVPASKEHRLATIMQQLGAPFYRRLDTHPDEFFATDFTALQQSVPYRFLHRHLMEGVLDSEVADADLRAMLERARALDRHLSETGEIEALLAGLAGGFVAPGPGGDPIRNPDVPSGRNLFPFEPDKIPTKAAYEAGGKAFQQLVDAYRAEHNGELPTKLAFSLWSAETMRHLGVMEAQVLHALGLRPVWNEGGRVVAIEIIPRSELGRPRIDAVVQVTSVYRDQFDGFMRLLADAIERVAALDEPDSAIAHNTRVLAAKLARQMEQQRAGHLAALRIFSNAPGDYGTALPGQVLKSASWEQDSALAEAFLDRLQYAYGSKDWGVRIGDGNLLAEQLKGTQAAVFSRSSKLHGILSTDHPFEYLGGLSLAIRHLDGRSPSLFITDLREQDSRVTSAARFLADEMRARYLNPHWIEGMKQEGYSGTLELLNAVNNFWGWQVTDPAVVRADQWQAIHDTYVRDVRKLALASWFEKYNPMAQAQILERLVEAIRKGYWNAPDQARRELVERWRELTANQRVDIGEPATKAFIDQMAAGFGLGAANANPAGNPVATPAASTAENVHGTVLRPAEPAATAPMSSWSKWSGLALLFICLLGGAILQMLSNQRIATRQVA